MVVSMDRWKGKVAVVTGASAGIGAAIALELVNQGMKVVGLARRLDRLEALKAEAKGPGELHAFQADVADEKDIEAAFSFVKTKFGAVHVLVNNAGVVRFGHISEQDPKHLRDVLNINVMGLTLCTQQAIKLMKEAGIDDGHIVHINSVIGHHIFDGGADQVSSMYGPSKFAVTALTEVLRQELRFMKSKIRVTSLSPGYVDTEIFAASIAAVDAPAIPAGFDSLKERIALQAQDIADGVVYVLSTPPHVQIHELTIKPILEPF